MAIICLHGMRSSSEKNFQIHVSICSNFIFHTVNAANNNSANQIVQMRRLISTIVVITWRGLFSSRDTYSLLKKRCFSGIENLS